MQLHRPVDDREEGALGITTHNSECVALDSILCVLKTKDYLIAMVLVFQKNLIVTQFGWLDVGLLFSFSISLSFGKVCSDRLFYVLLLLYINFNAAILCGTVISFLH